MVETAEKTSAGHGLAPGVDTPGHRGAIAAKGKIVAMFGIIIYAKENSRPVENMLALGGALVSEFPLNTFPAPQNFPIRNRIISGLSVGVRVVEAAEYSGTRITARCALEQNRELFAVPGNVTTKSAGGPYALIKQGEKLVAAWEDIWEELPTDVKLRLEPEVADESSSGQTASLFQEAELAPHEKRFLQSSRRTNPPTLMRLLSAWSPSSRPQKSSQLFFEPELAGKVRQLPGKNFVKSF